MSRDRYERKHRRTWKHPESIAFMASANFDAVPPLADALNYLSMTSDHAGVTESGREVPAGTTVSYLAHVLGGMVRVRFSDGAEDVMHPHCFPTLR